MALGLAIRFYACDIMAFSAAWRFKIFAMVGGLFLFVVDGEAKPLVPRLPLWYVGFDMSRLIDQLREIAARYNLGAVYAFGSRASEVVRRLAGETDLAALPDSDADIGVQSAQGSRLSARDRARLTAELEDLLGVKRVDLVILAEADPFLALDAISGDLLYCADRDSQAEEELHVLRQAADLAPFARERWKQILTGSAS